MAPDATTTVFEIVAFVLSIGCGVVGLFLLSQRGVRMMKGGLLYTISIGLTVIGVLLAVRAVGEIAGPAYFPPFWSALFNIIVLGTLFFVGYSAWATAHKLEEQVGEGI
jgi:phosphoglycerol transferase MdoB-like AlkP superfamily enzyme